MTIKFSLTEEDFLQYQLFAASRSDRINKRRRTSRIVLTALFILWGCFFLSLGDHAMMYCTFLVAIVTWLFYPRYLRHHYKKHYQSYIADVYKNRFHQPVILNFKADSIESKDRGGESKTNITEIEQVSETSDHFFLKLKTGESFILPKKKIENADLLKNELTQIAARVGAGYDQQLDWRWK